MTAFEAASLKFLETSLTPFEGYLLTLIGTYSKILCPNILRPKQHDDVRLGPCERPMGLSQFY